MGCQMMRLDSLSDKGYYYDVIMKPMLQMLFVFRTARKMSAPATKVVKLIRRRSGGLKTPTAEQGTRLYELTF